MPDRIKVFISSVQDPLKEDLTAEREAAWNAVTSVALAEPWAFEKAPASSKDAQRSYLDAVKQSDFLLLILGRLLTDAVENEYYCAKTYSKRILAFAKQNIERLTKTEKLLNDLRANVKYQTFTNAQELQKKCKDALEQEIVESVKDSGRFPIGTLESTVLKALRLKRTVQITAVRPICPLTVDNQFQIEDVAGECITLRKESSTQCVVIPTDKLTSIYQANNGYVLELNGRLQWTDPSQRWRYFPEKPEQSSMLGIRKQVGFNYPVNSGLDKTLRDRNYDVRWTLEHNLPGRQDSCWEIVYDDDGCYLAVADRPADQIYMKKRKT
jgi:hypothetical protein